MKKISLFILVLVIVSGQELVVENLTGAFTQGQKMDKVFNKPEWDNVLDFAVYGWFKINSGVNRANGWANAFQFTQNTDQNFNNGGSQGDRVLGFWVFNNQLHTPSYTPGNSNKFNDGSEPQFQNTDVDKWVFFYITCGAGPKRKFAYFGLPSGPKTDVVEGIVHTTSKYYKIFVGQSANWPYFPGSLYRVMINGGPGAYRESGFDQVQGLVPGNLPQCAVVYTSCGFNGTGVNVCEKKGSYDVSTIKSIYLPNGVNVILYDKTNFEGRKITYTQSIECITQLNWQLLVESKAIEVETTTTAKLRRQ